MSEGERELVRVGEGSSGKAMPVVDASVHVFFRGNGEIRDFLREPFKVVGCRMLRWIGMGRLMGSIRLML